MRIRHLLLPAGTLALVAAVPGLASASPTWSTSGVGVAAAKATVVTAPASITASASGSTVTVTWGAGTVPSGVARYWVERLPSPTGTAVDVCGSSDAAGITAVTCQDTSVPSGTYSYRVRTRFGGDWESASATTTSTVTVGTALTVTAPANGATTDKSPTFMGKAGVGVTVTVKVYTGTNTAVPPVRTLTITGDANSDWSVSVPSNNGTSGRLAANTGYTAVVSDGTTTISRAFTTNTTD